MKDGVFILTHSAEYYNAKSPGDAGRTPSVKPCGFATSLSEGGSGETGSFAAAKGSLFEGAVAAGDWGSLSLNAKKPRGAFALRGLHFKYCELISALLHHFREIHRHSNCNIGLVALLDSANGELRRALLDGVHAVANLVSDICKRLILVRHCLSQLLAC